MSTDALLQRLQHFQGDFECHLTADIASKQRTAFAQWSKTQGGKLIVIELAQGDSPLQPMLCKFYRGLRPETVVADIEAMISQLPNWAQLRRVKVEASLQNQSIPQNLPTAQAMPADCYFEHHLKLELSAQDDLSLLATAVQPFGAHLSRNAFARSGDQQSRFVTQRVYAQPDSMAAECLQALLACLGEFGLQPQKVIREYNIFDSCVDLDAGWISKPQT